MASVPPLFPTRNLIKSDVPTPEVDCKERLDPTPVPPITKGTVAEVAMVVAPFKDTAPVPVLKVLAPVWENPAATVTVPLAVKPEVAVIKPEMVGVAVQLVAPKVVVTPDLPKVNPVAFVPPTVKLPAESKAKVPEVAV